jgi:hypothetical protein
MQQRISFVNRMVLLIEGNQTIYSVVESNNFYAAPAQGWLWLRLLPYQIGIQILKRKTVNIWAEIFLFNDSCIT